MRRLALFLLTLAGLSAAPALWALPASGSFSIDKSCPAYISKNKRSNPDHAAVVAGKSYPVLAVNRADNPDWVQLRLDSASPSQRWVSMGCGRGQIQTGAASGSPTTGACNTAGEADAYVFAVSWQPAFCATHQGKPECGVHNPSSYQAGNFTLHGLWPNKSACGTSYGFCGQQQKVGGSFCNYPPLALNADTRRELGVVMPSEAAGSCLQRHEWYKHGTCQTGWDANGYFGEAIDLVQDFNNAGMGPFMHAHVGATVAIADFNAAADELFGEGAHRRMKLICNREGMLTDIYMNLPLLLQDRSLAELLQAGAVNDAVSNCGASFRVQAIGG